MNVNTIEVVESKRAISDFCFVPVPYSFCSCFYESFFQFFPCFLFFFLFLVSLSFEYFLLFS